MKTRPGETVHVHLTSREVAVAGAAFLLKLARVARSTPTVALSGGSTPRAMYDHLRTLDEQAIQPLRRARYFFGDERAVDNFNSESNVALAMNYFLQPLKVPYSMIEVPNGVAATPAAEVKRLNQSLRCKLARAAGGVPRFDLVFLGMGTDGHTASLFPGTRALESRAAGYVWNRVPQLKTSRLTLTFPVLNAAKLVVVMCTGENKATVLEDILQHGGTRRTRHPIGRLRPTRLVWLLDSAAASRLDDST